MSGDTLNLKDPCLAFQRGTNNKVIAYNGEGNITGPIVVRGTYYKEAIQYCKAQHIDYYIVDNGYLGMKKSKTDSYYRVTKNSHQYLGKPIKRDGDRFDALGLHIHTRRPGNNVLIACPSKSIALYEGFDLDNWTAETVQAARQYTKRKIIVREKPSRKERYAGNTFESALDDVHIVVCYNSIAGIEALLNGKPVIELGQSAVSPICNKLIANIECPTVPFYREVQFFMRHLAYLQYSFEELENGYAYSILEEIT